MNGTSHPRITLSGHLERITYTHPETGYTIARLRVKGKRDVVTVVGKFADPIPGETLEVIGHWKIHPKYGEQFEVDEYRTLVPSSIFGIKKYLGSGLIQGIGPVMAERIVDRFGRRSLEVIEYETDRLLEVEGIGEKRVEMIRSAWAEQKEIRDVMLFLQTHEVSAAYAVKIFKQYGSQAIDVVTENPYQLATDIFGIGFLTADKIARKLGFGKDSPLRIRAGILYVLNQLSDEGHVYYPYSLLIEKCCEILEVDPDRVAVAVHAAETDGSVVTEDLPDPTRLEGADGRAVYLSWFHVSETGIARLMRRLCTSVKSLRLVDAEKVLTWVEGAIGFTLAQKQKEAVQCAVANKVMVITGGPGTGKTTIIQALLSIFNRMDAKILLAAPTGRAAKRMSEATGHPAGTIHRLLSYSFQNGGFQKNENNPLACDLLIVDEASMVDTLLMYNLLKAVPSTATLILVGDVNQLPSVGAGNVLKDIIASGAVPVVRLTEIFRQAQESRIIVNAHMINNGIIPQIDPKDTQTDFYFIEQPDPERVRDIIVELAVNRIPKRFGFDPVNDIQVLTPMHKGVVGTANLNVFLQDALNPEKDAIESAGASYRVRDKVMQIRNNYDKNVFNGDIGRIAAISRETREVIIDYDNRTVTYDFSELDEVVPAYAVSVHKSQGSEFPAVVMPVLTQHYILLQRNLIYTAVTRGRRLVVLVGTKKALAIAVKNDKPQQRYTRLAQRLTI